MLTMEIFFFGYCANPYCQDIQTHFHHLVKPNNKYSKTDLKVTYSTVKVSIATPVN